MSWSWKSGDVVIWDNRMTERYAAGESSGRHRVERQIAINGDLPVAGPPSVVRTRSKPQAARAALFRKFIIGGAKLGHA